MAEVLRMPKLGLTMTEGTVVRWHKPSGAFVHRGEAVCDVETEKIAYTVEAPVDGFLVPEVPEGATVPVLAVIGYLRTSVDDVPSTEVAEGGGRTSEAAPEPSAVVAHERHVDGGGRLRVSPAARRRAEELGVDLRQVVGTGPGGRIQLEDVERFAAAARQTPPRTLTPMRRTIARRMLQSLQESAQLTLWREIDARALVRVREALMTSVSEEWGVRLHYQDLVLLALGTVLARHPELRRVMVGEEVEERGSVDIGVAVALEEGLHVPVIRRVEQLRLGEVARRVQDLADRARRGLLRPEDVGGAVMSVSNLGAYGVDGFTPILNPPEPMLLGIGRVRRAVWVSEEMGLLPAHTLTLSLTVDHRLIDGAPAAAFLAEVSGLLEHPWDWLREKGERV